jgi:hypothetical protein
VPPGGTLSNATDGNEVILHRRKNPELDYSPAKQNRVCFDADPVLMLDE